MFQKNNQINKGRIPWNKGKTFSEESKRKMSESHKGLPSPIKGKKGIHNSPSTEFKKGHVSWLKGTKGKIVGENHPMWGKRHNKESLKKMSEHRKGQPAWNKKERVKVTCMTCGKESYVKPSRVKRFRFCSHSCKAKHTFSGRMGAYHPMWRGGISFEPYCPKFNKPLKERIRERDNRTCQLCGAKENRRKLTVHHIHYDKPNCDPDLIALCISCNCKVNFNRDYYEELFMQKLITRGIVSQ